MKKKLNKEVEIALPSLPNFIRTNDGHSAIAVKEFSEKELKEIGKQWTEALIKKAKKK